MARTSQTRTNLVVNPSFESGITGWVATSANSSVAASSADAYVGTESLQLTLNAATGINSGAEFANNATYRIPCAQGQTFTASAYFRNTIGTRNWRIVFVTFQTATSTTIIETFTGGTAIVNPTTWTRASSTYTLTNANSNFLEIRVANANTGSIGDQALIDAVLVEETNELRPYFDGSTAEPYTGFTLTNGPAWTGTANASTSTTTWTLNTSFADPYTGYNWDVWVVLANDPNQTVAYVPRWKSIQFSDQLNDVGSATLEHDFSDSFFAAFQTERGDSLLEGPYALQIRRNGAAVFTFFIEDVQVDRAGTNQPLVIGGRGIGSALEWGIVIPEDFSLQARATAGTTQRPKFFDRLFPGYSFNTRVATTGNLSATYTNGPQIDVPGAGARLTSTSNGSINNTGIDGVTDLVVGDTVLVKNQSNAAHNGVYWIVTIGSASTPWVIQRTARADGSPISDLAIFNSTFVAEGTVNGYTSWAIQSNGSLSSSNQVGSVNIVWQQITLGAFTGISAFYILFKEADTGFEYSSKKEDFGTIKTLYGRGGVGYAVDWPLSLDAALSASQGTTDSKNRVVRDGGNFNIAVGRTLLDVLNEVASNTGVDWHVSPQGVISIAVRPFVTDTIAFDEPFGNDLTSGSAALLFSLPMLETVETRTSVSELRTVVYGSDGFNLDRQISDRTGTYGFREMFIENTSDDAPAVANITSSAVRQVRDGKLQITASFVENNGMVAWSNFNIGDKVLVEIDTGTFSERIISAISASVDDSGKETIEVTFGDVFQDIASNLKYAANYGRLGAAEIPTFTLRGTSSRPSAPTGTSVGAEVQGLSNRVVVGWEPVDASSATQYEAIVYREEQDSAGIAITYPIVDIYRDGNTAYGEVSSSTGFNVGDLINIYDTASAAFDRTSAFLTSASGNYFTFDDVGPDTPPATYTSGNVARVVERHSVIVPAGNNSAGFENLAAPGRPYQFTVIPYTLAGQAGVPSAPFPFTTSASPQILFNGAIRSNNYVADTSGWTIEASGDAELNQVTIRNGAWVQGTLTAPTLQTATSNPKLVITSAGLNAFNNAGDIVTSISSTTGALFSSSASISGNITANSLTASATIASPVITGGTIDIGGFDATSFHVDSSGNMWMGASTYATSAFRVSSAGDIRANSGAIAGFRIIGDNIITGDTYTGSMVMGPTSFGGQPAYQVEYTNGAEGVLSGGGLLLQQSGGALVNLVAGPAGAAEIVVSDGFYSTVIDATTIGVDFVNPSSTAGISVGGVGITYGGVTYGPGDRNFIGFLWTGTTVYATIDNVSGQYLGGAVFSDRRFKLNIAEPEQQWVDKILNDLKIWQFNKVNPLDEEDLHVYPLEIGVIADEYKQVFPQWESSILLMDPDGADSDKIKSVDYTGLIPGLVLIAQQYKNRFEALEERLTVLESQS